MHLMRRAAWTFLETMSKDATPKTNSGGEVYFEFTTIGPQVRVAALDARTGVEVVIIAPKTAPQSQMQQIAMAKLKKRLQSENLSD